MRSILVFLFLAGTLAVESQTIKKLYGFWHYNPQGNIPVFPPAGEGNEPDSLPQNRRPQRSKSHYIYFESDRATAPVVRKVILNGQPYQFSVMPVKDLPAVYTYYDGTGPKEIVLVPKGRKNVFLLALPGPVESAAIAKSSNELVVEYKTGKKTRTIVLKKLTLLPVSVVP